MFPPAWGLSAGPDEDGAAVGGRVGLVCVEDALGRTAYTGGVVIEIEGDVVRLVDLVLERSLGEVVGGVLVGVEVEGLIAGELHAASAGVSPYETNAKQF